MYWFLLIGLVVILLIAFLLRKRSAVKVNSVNGTLTTEELQRKKLELEMTRLENEMSNKDFEGPFKKYTGPVILILGFVGAVLAYVTQISVYVGNLNKNEKVQYTEIQIKAMENLDSEDDWTQRSGIRVLKTMEGDAVDILVERLSSMPKLEQDKIINRQGHNIVVAMSEIYKTIKEKPNAEQELVSFNTRIERSLDDAIIYYNKNENKLGREAPIYNMSYLVKFLSEKFKDDKTLKLLKLKIMSFLDTLKKNDPKLEGPSLQQLNELMKNAE